MYVSIWWLNWLCAVTTKCIYTLGDNRNLKDYCEGTVPLPTVIKYTYLIIFRQNDFILVLRYLSLNINTTTKAKCRLRSEKSKTSYKSGSPGTTRVKSTTKYKLIAHNFYAFRTYWTLTRERMLTTSISTVYTTNSVNLKFHGFPHNGLYTCTYLKRHRL